MSQVELRTVRIDEDGLRLDRWFRRHFPALPHGMLEKLVRKGQVRVDGGRIRTNHRLAAGAEIRVPPLPATGSAAPVVETRMPDARTRAMLEGSILHRDESILVLDKPSGLAVQGGSGLTRHLDGWLDALKFDAPERPRLVHRLDRDTSGLLVLGRTASAAAALAAAFRTRRTAKLYWALVVGVPRPAEGVIDAPLVKRDGPGGERVRVMDEGDDAGRGAITVFETIDRAPPRVAWMALQPRTGRTHQLRVHCATMGHPIVGDHKYGGAAARVPGLPDVLHLHARGLLLPHPDGGVLRLTAPLPGHMRTSWKLFEFDVDAPWAPLEEDRA